MAGDGIARTANLSIRLSVAEREALDEAAGAAGVTIGEFVRARLRRARVIPTAREQR